MIKGLFWCFTVLFVQLGLLWYVDLRVAAMPRLADPPPAEEEGDEPLPPAGELDA
ncbi:hypothetical protein QLQ85_03635 [Halomonas sp. M4R5S39]|uniref:hypothetical protein n=1 Tax=Halomonas kalidii TaxID=3043293 RepID=UPI0024A9FC7A|nr:hypothetical protein [Halomonas kalidii]MDI5983871.1 hypothetical protein [Halomonas kalidii]